MALRRILDRDQMIADPADMPKRAHGLAGVLQQGPLERRIGPGFCDHLRTIVRADFRLVGLDDGVERGRLDIAFLGQNRLERADAQFGFGQVRMVVIVMMVVIMVAHGLRIGAIFGGCRDGVCTKENACPRFPRGARPSR